MFPFATGRWRIGVFPQALLISRGPSLDRARGSLVQRLLVRWRVIGCWMVWLTAGGLVSQTEGPALADDHFVQNVWPILRTHCYPCHSHDHGTMEGQLALDWRSGWEVGGASGPAVIPGDVANSLLLKAVRHADPALQMPPEKLSDTEIVILETWVRTGAADPRVARPESGITDPRDWWSLRPLVRPEQPTPETTAATESTAIGGPVKIDAWIEASLAERELDP